MRHALTILLLLAFAALRAQSSLQKVDSLISDAQYDQANSLIAASTGDSRTNALLANRTAQILILQGKLDDAEKKLKSINAAGDPFVEAVTKTNLGFLYLNKARNDLALENLQAAYSKFEESGKRNTRECAQCLADLSSLYLTTGKFNQAEENGRIALQLRQELFGENSEEVAASYNDLGLIYGANDPEKALGYYEKALAIYERVHGKDHPKIAIVSNNIGAMYRQMELYGDAVNNFELALTIWKKVYPNGHPNQAAAMINLGRTYIRMGNAKTALAYFRNALPIYQAAYGRKHPDISAVYNLIASLQLGDNKYDSALLSTQSAIISNSPDFESGAVERNPKIGAFYNGKVLLYSLRLKAEAFEARHYGKTLKLEDLKLALSCLQSSDTLIDNIRHHSSDENDKIELGESANEVYEDGVRLAESMSEISLENKRYREIAFYFAEKSKSAVLQESIADAEAKSFAGIPSQLVDQENNLKSTIAFLTQKLSQKPTAEEEKYLREALFSTNQEYDAFVKKLEADYPNYFNLKYNASSPATTDIQKLLDDKTAVVSYFIADKKRRLYQFIITRNHFRIRSLGLQANFEKMITGLNNGLLYGDLPTYHSAATVLSPLLVVHFPARITNVVLIPSGRLGTIPFEALLYRPSKELDYARMPWVVTRYAVSYEFSAGLLAQKAKSASPPVAPSIFLCAPVHFPDKDNVDELPGTEKEVSQIGALFGGDSKLIAKYGEANEDFVKSGSLSKYNYLHFATHGLVDETDPELSRIFLQTGAQDDGNLFAGEIYNMHLNAELTVLSACQTGLGKFSKGEGVIGLSRALVYAGSKNIIVSFWSVADESTSQLMTDFYRILLGDKRENFRETLQKAKLKMIQGGKYKAPYYWAPFVLIGF